MMVGIQPNSPQEEVWYPEEMERSVRFDHLAHQHLRGLSSQRPESILDNPEGMA